MNNSSSWTLIVINKKIKKRVQYFNPIKSLKLSNNTLPTQVVNKTINKTQPYKTFAFGVSI